MASGRYEVYAAVHPGVWDPFLPVNVDFLLQVGFILVIDELHDGLPAVTKKIKERNYYLKTSCKQLLCYSDSFFSATLTYKLQRNL